MTLQELVDDIRGDWAVEVDDLSFHAVRRDVEPADGYPPEILAGVHKGRLQDGLVVSQYRTDIPAEEYSVGPRSIEAVLLNVHHPFKYKPIWDVLQAQGPEPIPEKQIGAMLDVSERQIRKARILGFVGDEGLLDRLCVSVLHLHPAELYGAEAWISGVDITREHDIPEDHLDYTKR